MVSGSRSSDEPDQVSCDADEDITPYLGLTTTTVRFDSRSDVIYEDRLLPEISPHGNCPSIRATRSAVCKPFLQTPKSR